MKLVIAVIRPEQLPAVKQALFDAQIQHLTATTVMGTAPKSEQQMYVAGVGSWFSRSRTSSPSGRAFAARGHCKGTRTHESSAHECP
jgi:hypothetical protein